MQDNLKMLKNTYIMMSVMIMVSLVTAFTSNVCPYFTNMFTESGVLFSVGVSALAILAMVGVIFTSSVPLTLLFSTFIGLSIGQILYTKDVSSDTLLLAGIGTIAIFVLTSYYTIKNYMKHDFSKMGTFLLVALITLIVMSIANIFIGLAWLEALLSYAAIILFSGFIMYDTSEIMKGHYENYVQASIGMFLNIVNIFINLVYVLED